MTLRPRAARWFEAIAARDDAYLALEALANAGCVEIEWHAGAPAAGAAAAALKRYSALARRYSRYWPPAELHLAADPRAPADALADGVARLEHWSAEVESRIVELQQADATRADLALADQALAALADSQLDFALLARSQGGGGGGVVSALFALPATARVPLPAPLLTRQAPVGDEMLLLAVGPGPAIETLARSVIDANGRRARFPDWLQPSADASRAQIAQQSAALAARAEALRAQIAAAALAHGVARALGDIARATWCFEHGGAISLGDRAQGDVFARLTGWVTDPARVIAAIEASGARALVAFPPPPPGARPPLALANPWWARPFEVFPRLVGMPGAQAADPSVLLALAVPLMFGYMFGDIGQGLVLAAVGWLLRDRLPVLRLLVPAGLAAAVFGWVFGSVFSLEHLVAPLWLHPLSHPLPVLLVPVVAGALLLTLGLLLGLLQASWQQQAGHWLRADGPVLLVYLGVLAGLFLAAAGLTGAAAVGWLLAALGAVLAPVLASLPAAADPVAAAGTRRTPLAHALAALGELIERTLQLLINTLSFARVGAFALAHAGLSSAVISLAHAIDSVVAQGAVLVLGNLLILAVEGLVVSIQTTRLVLFEFFTRFFQGDGREFRPLLPPPAHLTGGDLAPAAPASAFAVTAPKET